MARDFGRSYAVKTATFQYSTAKMPYTTAGYVTSSGRGDLIRRNKIAGFRRPTPYLAHRSKIKTGLYYYQSSAYVADFGESMPPDGDYSGVYAGCTGLYPEIRPQYSQSQINNTINGAIGKLSDDDLNIGQTLGELPTTIRFVASSTVAVLNAYKWTRGGEYKKAFRSLYNATPEQRREQFKQLYRDHVRDVPLKPAEAWLSLQLGWKPLLGDIKGAINAYQRSASENAPIASVVKNNEYDNPWLMPYGGPYNLRSYGKGRTTISCKLYYGVESTMLAKLQSVNLINPYAVAWDLVPLSFFLDWFIPVGDFIRSLTAFQGLQYYGGYYTLVNRINCTTTYECGGRSAISGILPSYSVDNFVFQRVELPLPPAGRFAFYRMPRFNLGKAATALSLMTVLSSW